MTPNAQVVAKSWLLHSIEVLDELPLSNSGIILLYHFRKSSHNFILSIYYVNSGFLHHTLIKSILPKRKMLNSMPRCDCRTDEHFRWPHHFLSVAITFTRKKYSIINRIFYFQEVSLFCNYYWRAISIFRTSERSGTICNLTDESASWSGGLKGKLTKP